MISKTMASLRERADEITRSRVRFRHPLSAKASGHRDVIAGLHCFSKEVLQNCGTLLRGLCHVCCQDGDQQDEERGANDDRHHERAGPQAALFGFPRFG